MINMVVVFVVVLEIHVDIDVHDVFSFFPARRFYHN